jgi:hypothetical protein
MWIVVLILGIIFMPIGGIIAGSGDKTGLILVGLGVVLIAVAVINRNRIKRQKAARAEANKAYMTDQDLQTIQAGGLPSVSGVPVVLADGEVAHYFAPARRYITKTKAIGRTGSGGGVRVRVAKGVSVAAGGGASQTVYDDVTDSFPGQIVLTDRRIVFLAQQNGFDCKLDAISAITPEGDRIMIQAGAKNYRLLVAQQGHFAKVLDKVVG